MVGSALLCAVFEADGFVGFRRGLRRLERAELLFVFLEVSLHRTEHALEMPGTYDDAAVERPRRRKHIEKVQYKFFLRVENLHHIRILAFELLIGCFDLHLILILPLLGLVGLLIHRLNS